MLFISQNTSLCDFLGSMRPQPETGGPLELGIQMPTVKRDILMRVEFKITRAGATWPLKESTP
jgi:hypothetical protein